MTETAGTAKPRSHRRQIIIGVIVALVVVGWSAGWFVIRGEVAKRLDQALAGVSARGVAVTCLDRGIGGYPFRIEVSCRSPAVAVEATGAKASAGALRAVVLLYQPKLVIVELDGPFDAVGPAGETVKATWSVLQTSIHLGDALPNRISVSSDDFDVTAARAGFADVHVTGHHGEMHLRPTPETQGFGDFDYAAALAKASFTVGGRRIGPEGADIALDATVHRLPPPGAAAGPAYLRAWADNDGSVELRNVALSAKDASLEGKGAIALEPDGRVTGSIKLLVSGLDVLAAESAKGTKAGPEVAVLASGFFLFGKSVKDGPKPGRSLELAIDQGRIKLGNTALGTLAPLF